MAGKRSQAWAGDESSHALSVKKAYYCWERGWSSQEAHTRWTEFFCYTRTPADSCSIWRSAVLRSALLAAKCQPWMRRLRLIPSFSSSSSSFDPTSSDSRKPHSACTLLLLLCRWAHFLSLLLSCMPCVIKERLWAAFWCLLWCLFCLSQLLVAAHSFLLSNIQCRNIYRV